MRPIHGQEQGQMHMRRRDLAPPGGSWARLRRPTILLHGKIDQTTKIFTCTWEVGIEKHHSGSSEEGGICICLAKCPRRKLQAAQHEVTRNGGIDQ